MQAIVEKSIKLKSQGKHQSQQATKSVRTNPKQTHTSIIKQQQQQQQQQQQLQQLQQQQRKQQQPTKQLQNKLQQQVTQSNSKVKSSIQKDIRQEVIAVHDAVKKIKEVFAMDNRVTNELRNKSIELNLQKKYIEDETQKESEAVGIISASYALGMKKCSEIEEAVDKFMKYSVETCRGESTELRRRFKTARIVLHELQRDIQPLKHALEAVFDDYHSSDIKVKKFSNDKQIVKGLRKDVKIRSSEFEKSMKELHQRLEQSKEEIILIVEDLAALTKSFDTILSDLTMQVVSYQTIEKGLEGRGHENKRIIAVLKSENEAKKSKITQLEEEDSSINIIESSEELKKIKEKRAKESSAVEKNIALNAFKTNELSVSKDEIIKVRNDLDDLDKKGKMIVLEIEKISQEIVEKKKILAVIRHRNVEVEAKSEDYFRTFKDDVNKLHELTKSEPLVMIDVAQAREDLSLHLTSLETQYTKLSTSIKTIEVETAIEKFLEEKEGLVAECNQHRKSLELVIPQIENKIANITATTESINKDIAEKTTDLDEIVSKKLSQTAEMTARSPNDVKKNEDEVAKKLKKDKVQMQKDYDSKAAEINNTLCKIRNREIKVLPKSSHIKEIEYIEKQINDTKESFQAKVVQKSSLPPPTTQTLRNARTKAALITPILKEMSPAKSYVSDQSDNMFEDLVSHTFRPHNPKATVSFSSQVADKSSMKAAHSQSYTESNFQSKRKITDKNEMSSDDHYDEDITEEIPFITMKTQQDQKFTSKVQSDTTGPRRTETTVQKHIVKRTSGYESFDSLQSLSNIAKNNSKTVAVDNSRQLKKGQVATTVEKDQVEDRKPKATRVLQTLSHNIPKKSTQNEAPVKTVALTKSNVAKLTSSQPAIKKRSRAWDDDSAVDFSKL